MLRNLLILFCKLCFGLFISISVFAEVVTYKVDTDFQYDPNLRFKLESWLFDQSGRPMYQVKKILGQGFDGIVFSVEDSKGNQFALRLPRLLFKGEQHKNYKKQKNIYDLGLQHSSLFLSPLKLVSLEVDKGRGETTGILFPIAELPFENEKLSKQEKVVVINDILNSILPRYFDFAAKGLQFNDLALRNVVKTATGYYLIDLERVASIEKSVKKVGDLSIASPELFNKKSVHITSDMFSLALSIARHIFSEDIDFRFSNLGKSPFTSSMLFSDFAEFYQRKYYQDAYESETFELNKKELLSRVSKLPNSKLIYDFLNSAFTLNTDQRVDNLNGFTQNYGIKSGSYFCRALF